MTKEDDLREGVENLTSLLNKAIMENSALKERLAHTQDALKVVLGEKLCDLDDSRSRRVEAEREACAVEVETLARSLGEMVNSQMTVGALREIQMKLLLLKDVAAMIRASEGAAMAVGIRQAMILRALRDHPDRAYAGGVHEVVYEQTEKKVIITSDTVCQVFKTLQVRGLIERAETPPEAELARRGRRGGPRKFYKLTDAGHAEMAMVDKVVALFQEREWRQE